MRKNYLLLFLIALLFGTGTMRGQSLSFEQIKSISGGSTHFVVKIGKGYLHFKDNAFNCVSEKTEATKFDIHTEGSDIIDDMAVNGVSGVSLTYNARGVLKPKSSNSKFNYIKDDKGNYYLTAAQTNGRKGWYVTNDKNQLALKKEKTDDAIVEITVYKASETGGNDPEKGKKLQGILAMFQYHHEQKPGQSSERTEGPFIGDKLGQYTNSNTEICIPDEWKRGLDNMFRNAANNSYDEHQLQRLENIIKVLKITTVTKGYVYITTKSQFEHAVRENSTHTGFSSFPVSEELAGKEQPAQYLKATKSGYELTKNKAEASVFYFDGEHLTGVNFGFGLGECKYDQTEDNQKIEITQGKLEKTLDAGSYCLKVNGQYVKFGTNGISLSANESDSHIFLEEATEFTLNTDALGYASFYAPTAVEIPDGVEVYTGHLNSNNSVVQFKKVATKQIPAETAVLMRKGTSQTSFVVKKTTATPTAFTDNALKGYTVSSNQRLASAYGFTVQGNKLVFKPISDGIRAFKAVIFNNNAAGAQEVLETSFAPTGVEGVEVDENSQEVFDLAGRRVEFPVKGQIYVKDGKKFVQK